MAVDAIEALAQLCPPDLRELLRSRTLALKRPVWGRRHGRHRSARAGVGLDFRDHRGYVPGDDPRQLDWRAAARSDRLVLRQTEAEDELSIVLAVDGGGGMGYGDGVENKLEAARAIAGGLAWLATRQGDRIGLAIGTGGKSNSDLASPSSSHERARAFARTLLDAKPEGVCPWERLLGDLAPRLPRRSLVVVMSDLLDPGHESDDAERVEAEMFRGLASLRAHSHDIVVVQVLHADEVEFPWTERRMLRFLDLGGRRPPMEGPGSEFRTAYLESLQQHLRWVEDRCEAEGLFFQRVVTRQPVAGAFTNLIGRLAGRVDDSPRSDEAAL